jgi:hypothetical protein
VIEGVHRHSRTVTPLEMTFLNKLLRHHDVV